MQNVFIKKRSGHNTLQNFLCLLHFMISGYLHGELIATVLNHLREFHSLDLRGSMQYNFQRPKSNAQKLWRKPIYYGICNNEMKQKQHVKCAEISDKK
jgi:hypothetical protein